MVSRIDAVKDDLDSLLGRIGSYLDGLLEFTDIIGEVHAFMLANFEASEIEAFTNAGINLADPALIKATIEANHPVPNHGLLPSNVIRAEVCLRAFVLNLQFLLFNIGSESWGAVFNIVVMTLKDNLSWKEVGPFRVEGTAGRIFGDGTGMHERRDPESDRNNRDGLVAREKREGLSVDDIRFPFRQRDVVSEIREEMRIIARRGEISRSLNSLWESLVARDKDLDKFGEFVNAFQFFALGNFTVSERGAFTQAGIDLANPDSLMRALEAKHPDDADSSNLAKGAFLQQLGHLLVWCVASENHDKSEFNKAIGELREML